MTEQAKIGIFNDTDRLSLRRAPNGGWIVSAHNGNPAYSDDVIGAYGSASEMLAALAGALTATHP